MALRPEGHDELMTDAVHDALDELRATASDRQTSCASLALAWVIGHPDCTAPVVGPSRAAPHLGHVSEAVRLRLASDEHRRIGDWFGRSE